MLMLPVVAVIVDSLSSSHHRVCGHACQKVDDARLPVKTPTLAMAWRE